MELCPICGKGIPDLEIEMHINDHVREEISR